MKNNTLFDYVASGAIVLFALLIIYENFFDKEDPTVFPANLKGQSFECKFKE